MKPSFEEKPFGKMINLEYESSLSNEAKEKTKWRGTHGATKLVLLIVKEKNT